MRTEIDLLDSQSKILRGEIKWFKPSKGFGFVKVTQFEEDFLLHRNVLENYGQHSVVEGAYIEFLYEELPSGFRVTKIQSIEGVPERESADALPPPDHLCQKFVPARVKWYDPNKGYGFVNCFGCSEDVFVGSDVLNRSGLLELRFGEALCIQISTTDGQKRVHQIRDWLSE